MSALSSFVSTIKEYSNRVYDYFTQEIPSDQGTVIPDPTPATSVPETPGTFSKIKTDVKEYVLDPINKVKSDPLKALVYSIAFKIMAYATACIFPYIGFFIGSVMVGLSIGLIDKEIYNNFNELKADLMQRLGKQAAIIAKSENIRTLLTSFAAEMTA